MDTNSAIKNFDENKKHSSMITPSMSNFLEEYFNNSTDISKQNTHADISSKLKKINKSQKSTKNISKISSKVLLFILSMTWLYKLMQRNKLSLEL